ncbi:MAG: hypothetical protein ACFHHU_05010 [Porticoccaceae bacterium]
MIIYNLKNIVRRINMLSNIKAVKQRRESIMLINILLIIVGGLLAAIFKSEADYANHE